MKKILNALFLTLLAVFTFSSCSDVPAPYDILDESSLPGVNGDGTKENPYDVAALLSMQKTDKTVAWVQGYIVGCVDGEGKTISSESKFEAPFTKAANMLIADSPSETNYKNCIPVQLVSGTDIRTALNLVDHADNLGKVVLIQGSLEKYFGVAGLKAPTAAVLDKEPIGDAGTDEPAGSLAEKLDASNPVSQVVNTFDDAATDVDYVKEGYVNFAEVGGRTWRGKPFNNDGLIQATAYGSKEASVISWFVTPAVEVAKMEVKKLSFSCISAYYVEGNNLEVYFLEKNGAELTQTLLNVGTLPQNTSGYSAPATLTADLTAFDGKIGFIGFKYVGGGTATGTYQIDNLYVGVESGAVVEPDPTPIEGTELLTNGGFENWADGYPVSWKSASTAGNATLEQSTDKRNGEYAVLVKGATANKRLGSVEMTLKAGTYTFSAYFKAANAGEEASAVLGYVPVSDGKVGQYVYGTYSNGITNTDWVAANSYTFTLENEQTICLVVMNSKSAGKDVLVDDASLKTIDGGIVGGEVVEPEPSVDNLLINPGFEEWVETLPTAWDNSKYNTGEIIKETTIKHGGNNSLRQKSDDSTQKIQQEVAVKGGKKYRISYWFLDNDPKARSRYWFALVDGQGKTVNDLNSEIQQSSYSEDNSEWQQVKIEITLPENVVKMRYEVRTYRGEDAKGTGGGYIYYDDMELVEIE